MDGLGAGGVFVVSGASGGGCGGVGAGSGGAGVGAGVGGAGTTAFGAVVLLSPRPFSSRGPRFGFGFGVGVGFDVGLLAGGSGTRTGFARGGSRTTPSSGAWGADGRSGPQSRGPAAISSAATTRAARRATLRQRTRSARPRAPCGWRRLTPDEGIRTGRSPPDTEKVRCSPAILRRGCAPCAC